MLGGYNIQSFHHFALLVMHGEDLVCNGYAFSLDRGAASNDGKTNVVYASQARSGL